MIEAKDKEQAVLYLYKLYNLYPVNENVFYENTKVETKYTMKSKKGLKAAKLEAEIELDDASQYEKARPKQKRVKHQKVTVADITENDAQQVKSIKKRSQVKHEVKDELEVDTTEALQIASNESEASKGPRRSKRTSRKVLT
jgi:hypothetical protein